MAGRKKRTIVKVELGVVRKTKGMSFTEHIQQFTPCHKSYVALS